MNRRLALGWLIYSIVGSAPLSFSASAEAHQRSVLEGARELEKAVTYTETKIPLGELVQKVAEDTGVQLTAATDVADEPVAVVVKEFPARELLEQLADLLDYQWSRRRGQGASFYEIWQDLASKQREEALRRATFDGAVKRLRDEVARFVEVAALSQEQIEHIPQAEEQRRKELGHLTSEHRLALLTSPEESERRRRISIATRLASPIPRALAGLLGRLSSQQWAIMSEGRDITFSTDPQPGELLLPPKTAQVLRVSQPSRRPPGARIVFSDPPAEEAMRQREREMQEQWAAATGYRVTIRLDANPSKTRGSLFLIANATPIRSGAPFQSIFFGSGMDTSLLVGAAPVDFEQGWAEDTPQRRAALADDPVVGARKVLKLEPQPRTEPPGPRSDTPRRFLDLLPNLARTYNVHFILDSYWNTSPGFAAPSITTEPVALYLLLDQFAGSTFRWDHRGGLVRLRSRTWFVDRPREVPLRFVRRWKEVSDRHGALPMELYAEMAIALKDGQLASLGELVREAGLARDFYDVYPARYALSLYASLTPAQRQHLWEGQAIPVAAMAPKQQDLFDAALQELDRSGPTPQNRGRWTAASLSLTGERFERIREQRGSDTIYRMDPVTTPTGEPGRPPEISSSGLSKTRYTRVGPPHADTGSDLRRVTPALQRISVTRHLVTQAGFRFRYGPELMATVYLKVASPP